MSFQVGIGSLGERCGVQWTDGQTDGQTDRWKKWHIEVGVPPKKDTTSKNKAFITHSLCSYYRFLWGKCKDL